MKYIRRHRTCTLIISFFVKGNNTISRNLILEDGNGHAMNAMKVFSTSIKYFKDHFMEKNAIFKLVETDVHWVLTVPAIWKDNAKQFMREAAEQVFVLFVILYFDYCTITLRKTKYKSKNKYKKHNPPKDIQNIHRKVKIKQHVPTVKIGVNSVAPEGFAFLNPGCDIFVLFPLTFYFCLRDCDFLFIS